MNQLIHYLRENLILDFQGDLSFEMARDLLRSDPSMEAKKLLDKLISDGGMDEMLLVVADCLIEEIREALCHEIMLEQLRAYSES